MTVTKLSDGTQVIEGKHIPAFRMLALKGALKLETLGMKHSSGISAASVIKREFGLKARTNKELLAKYEALLRERGILV